MKVTVAAAQFQPRLHEVERNLERMQALVADAAARGARLVVLPELATSGYEAGPRFSEHAEPLDASYSLRVMGDCTARHGVYVVYGFPERDTRTRDVLYNSAALVGPDGDLVGVYRKVHLFAAERTWFRPGWDYPLFETDVGRLGVFICWDVAFPEPARIYALKGADLLVVSSNYEHPYAEDWDMMCAARALDNVLPLVAANRIGRDVGLAFFGHSRILDPLGRPLATLDEEREGVIVAEIDTEDAIRRREEYYTFFKDRRPDTYGEICRPM